MDYIDLYRKHFNAKLFPLKQFVLGDQESKVALESGWQDKEYSDEVLRAYVAEGHSLGWMLGPRDIVIDLDVATAERPDKQGDQIRPVLENLMGDARMTTIVESPSGGKHYYMRLPEGVDSTAIRTKIHELPSVDIRRFRQHVVMAGSPHWQGGHYEFSAETKLFGFYENATLSPALLKYLQRDEKLESTQIEKATVNVSLLDDILSVLPAEQFRDHATWFGVMCACHHVTSGSDEGLESFLRWSTSDPKYAEHGGKITKRWNSLNPHKARGYTLGTLLYELRQFGREDVVDLVRLRLDFGDPPAESSTGVDVSVFDVPTTATRPQPSADERPWFEKSAKEGEFNDQLIDLLARQDEIYARLDQLTYVSIDGDLHHRVLSPLGLCEHLSRIARTGKTNQLGVKNESVFSTRNGTQIVQRQKWKGVKNLRRITPMPILSERGLHQTLGYDPTTGLYYHTPDYAKIPKIPRSPDKQKAQESLAILIDLIDEFPFAEPCHRSAWLASLLGIVARPMLGPCAPMTLIDGNRSGAGKGMLCDLICDICLAPGQVAGKFTGLDKDESEQRKMFLALARENPLIGIFDNLKSGGSIGSPVLDAILTTGAVSGRVLGLTKLDHAEFDTTLFATANRIEIDANSDLLRRIFYILLETPSENPEQQKFKYPEVRAQAQQNRGMYLAAALTIMEYARANRGKLPYVAPWGSYGGYDIVRQVLVDLGEPDPRGGISKLAKRHQGATELGQVIRAMAMIGMNAEEGMTCREIWLALMSEEFEDDKEKRATLQDARVALVPPWCKGDPVVAIARRMSSQFRDQMHEGHWIRQGSRGGDNTKVYFLRAAEDEEVPF
jgi:hypothetical protein